MKVGINEYVRYEQSQCRQEHGSFGREEKPGAKKERSERREISPIDRCTGEDEKKPVEQSGKS